MRPMPWSDVRVALNRNLQSLQALHAAAPGPVAGRWRRPKLLREQRELVRLNGATTPCAAHPCRNAVPAPMFDRLGRENARRMCRWPAPMRGAQRTGVFGSYFVPQPTGSAGGDGAVPAAEHCNGRASGFLVATYSLQESWPIMVGQQLTRSQEVSFTEPDGTRLAVLARPRRGTRMFTAQQLLDLPGNTLVLRLDSWRGAPSVFPNVLTALVTAMSIALVTVVVLLARDNRRRLRAERDLAEALAFRKAMEDSLVTGLRARDLQGRITYVNPAFCQMVGFHAEELLGQHHPALLAARAADEYRAPGQRWLCRSGRRRARAFETVFMRKDGTRFPVLIFEAPLINAQGLHTGWMSAVLDISEQRRWKSCRAPARSACRPPPAWPRWARWPRCSATS
jgi:two-component system sensor histidine kinase DctS